MSETPRERLARDLCRAFRDNPDELAEGWNSEFSAFMKEPRWRDYIREADILIAAGYMHRDEAMEEAAKKICRYCRDGLPRSAPGAHLVDGHDELCQAAALRQKGKP